MGGSQIDIEATSSHQPSIEQLGLASNDYNKRSSDENVDENNRKSTGHSDNVILTPGDDFKFYNPRSKMSKTVKQSIIFLIVSIAFFIANLLYVRSDQPCPLGDDVDRCVQEYILPNAVKWLTQVSTAAFIISTIIVVGLHKKIHPLYALVGFANVIYLCFYYHPIINRHEYGQAFALFFGVIVFLYLWVVSVVKTILYCLRKRRRLTIIGVPAFLLLLFCLVYFTRWHNNCGNWNKGINGGSLQDVEGTCQIVQPDICAFDITDGWFDLSRFTDCKDCKSESSIMEKFYPGVSPIVAFPRTETMTLEQRDHHNIQKNVLNNVAYFESMNDKGAQDHEIFLDKTNEDDVKMKIQVKRNEALAQQRSQIKDVSAAKNVLVIYIDALSRAGAVRSMKKTLNWFEKRSSGQSSNYDSFQFFKYHSITPYTTLNLQEALFGTQRPRWNDLKQKPVSFLKTFKENGYITGHSTDFCQNSPLDMYPEDRIVEEPYDHEGISFACDPHYTDIENPYALFKGPYSSKRRCLYGNDVADYVLDYGTQFWNAYPQEKKILYMDFLDAHEGTGEVVKYLDVKLESFLTGLESNGKLDDTTVMLYSDHGLHMHGLFFFLKAKVVQIEIGLPMLFLSTPKEVSSQHKDNIKSNEQKLISAHDIHYTLLSLANKKDKTSLNTSLMANLPKDRTCADIGVTEQPCQCVYN